ncbi:hypothetical protein LSG31_01715 [Fodinisporobacter ferrooxydans]|uniref:Transposase n=1 Tax=Fodinisporobacter ferrooxydans TaxID=2901836 RepID=A0ABY4CPA1_9BACL|nr:hypothetical protein LSG31_01715 [Alicyclobacillaceae bacterium MYW30-H2]
MKSEQIDKLRKKEALYKQQIQELYPAHDLKALGAVRYYQEQLKEVQLQLGWHLAKEHDQKSLKRVNTWCSD